MKLTRRELIKSGTAAGLATLGGSWSSLLLASTEIRMTTIPSSGQKLPCVGIGTNRFRGDPGSEAMAPLRATLEVFHRLGGRVIDTSPNYGNSEEVLGRLLEELGVREEMFLARRRPPRLSS